MTIEEAIKILTSEIYSDEIAECGVKFKEALNTVIDVVSHEKEILDALRLSLHVQSLIDSMLEKEKHKLDKIRVEIEEHRNKTKYIDQYDLVGDCLDIIDKYKEVEIRNDL